MRLRSTVLSKMKSMLDNADAEKRDLTEVETKEYNKLEEEAMMCKSKKTGKRFMSHCWHMQLKTSDGDCEYRGDTKNNYRYVDRCCRCGKTREYIASHNSVSKILNAWKSYVLPQEKRYYS